MRPLASLTPMAEKAGTTIFSNTFTALADAETYFNDHSINLGAFAPGSLSVYPSFGLTASGAKGADFSYLVAAAGTLPTGTASSPNLPAPEPATWATLVPGWACWGAIHLVRDRNRTRVRLSTLPTRRAGMKGARERRNRRLAGHAAPERRQVRLAE